MSVRMKVTICSQSKAKQSNNLVTELAECLLLKNEQHGTGLETTIFSTSMPSSKLKNAAHVIGIEQ